MVLVSDIIKTKSFDLFNEAKSLSFVLYKLGGHSVRVDNNPFKYSVTHSDILEPVAYSDSYDELYYYALNLGLSDYEIVDNPCRAK